MSATRTEISQMDVAMDFAIRVNDKMVKAGIKTPKFGLFDDGHQIAIGVDIDGRRVAEQIMVGASNAVVDDMVRRFSELVEAKAKTYVRRGMRRTRQNKALQHLLTS